MTVYAAKVAFWADPDNMKSFVGSGTVVGAQQILTAKHLFGNNPQAPSQLWVRAAINATSCLKVEKKYFHETLDIALVTVTSFPSGIAPMACDYRQLEQAKSSEFTLNGFFEGRHEEPQPLVVTQLDGQENHFLTDAKQPTGQSGGAVCADGKLWAVSTRHYADANIVRGCAIAVHQFEAWLKGLLPNDLAVDFAIEIVVGPKATPAQTALAKVLSKPGAWAALTSTGFIATMEKQLRQLLSDAAFSLPNLQSLYDVCSNPAIDPKQLLYRINPAITGVSGSHKKALQDLTGTLRETVLTLCNVLAERYVLGAAQGAGRASLHDVQVPVASEAIAVVIAAVWVHGAHGVHLDMGVRADAGKLVAHGAINVTNAPLEIGYVPAESASNLVKYQLMATQEAYSAVVPLPEIDYFVHSRIPARKEELAQKLGRPGDLVLTYDSAKCPTGHVLSTPQAREKIKAEFGLWTVVYGEEDAINAKDAPVRQLARDLNLAFSDIYKHV